MLFPNFDPASFHGGKQWQTTPKNLKECHPRCVYQNYSRSMIKNSSQKTQLYLYVQERTNYMFQPFPNWPSSGWIQMSEELHT
jgi:hypothetical protein